MKNKNISMDYRLINSTVKFKSVFSLFLGLILSMTTLAQNCQIIDSTNVTDVRCHNGNDGAIDVVLLLPGLYTFAWSNGEVTEDILNLSAGTYSVQIIDQNNPTCYQDTTYIITEPQDDLSTAATLYSDVNCFGDSSGVAFAENAIGGTFPYTYLWSNGETTQLVVNLWGDPSGQGVPFTHTVTVTDANGCTAQATVDIVNSNPPITGASVVLNQVSCFNACDATVEFSAQGGVLPLIYQWDMGQVFNGSGPDTAFNVCYGGHDVLVEDDLGCLQNFTYIITQPDELFAEAEMVQPVQCFGFDDGMAYASATQGTPTYYFVWDSIPGVSDNYTTGQNIDSLTPGIHTVYVTDANGCTAYDTVTITEPTLLEVDIILDSTVYAYCANTNSGELCAEASGGTPAYQYLWNDVIHQTTPCAYNLQADQYIVVVMDDRNCIATASFDLDSITNSMNEDSVVIDITPVTCFGIYNGELNVSSVPGGLGGVGPYSYSWSGPGTYTGIGANITALYFGDYSVLITDDNGCAMTVGEYLPQPDELEYTIHTVINETCSGADNGEFWVHVEGGTGDYYYDLDEIGNFTVPPTPNPFANPVQLVNDTLITDLSFGVHSIYITDDNGCEGAVIFGGVWQDNVGADVTVATPLLTYDPTSCFNTNDGFAEVDDPNSLYTYTWEVDNAGVSSGVDITNGANTSWGNFAPGTYWLVAHYADSASFGIPYYGCDAETPFTILPGNFIDDGGVSNINHVSCFGYDDGGIALNVTGTSPTFTMQWDTTYSHPQGSTSDLLLNLIAGTYTVVITDADGCSLTTAYEVTQPEKLISDIEPNHASCFGFSDAGANVTTIPTSGTGPYSYSWNNGILTEDLTNVVAGTYWVTITDAAGCEFTDTVQILEPADPVAEVAAVDLYIGDYDVRCNGESNAAALATGSGVSFEWYKPDNTGILYSNGQQTIDTLSAGLYTVYATDINNCIGEGTITITEPNELIIDVNDLQYALGYQISCFGANDGMAEVTIIGGVDEATTSSGYYIDWVNNITTPPTPVYGHLTAVNLEGAILGDPDITYTVTVQDVNGCEDKDTTVPFIQPILFDVNVPTVNYSGPFHAPYVISFIDSTVSDEPYDFVWTWQDESIELFTSISSGNNTLFSHDFVADDLGENYVMVMVTNNITGCYDSVEFNIEVQGLPETANVFSPNSDNVNDEFTFNEYAMESVDVQIFNRWGQMVYTWVGENKSWNGKGIDGSNLPEGVYFFVFKGDGVDGHYYEEKGSITLLR
jgi:gliding motility-associated-like protein